MDQENQRYFAAANSYDGFISFFENIFKSDEFDYIYVIKGGPGTGKSSLMRSILSSFNDKAEETEEIYCSSDPHSLDAVIIKNNKKQIAILDGTAPHQTDAKIPGVKDEIINLGDNWDKPFLSAHKDSILSINKGKSGAYKTAYSYLSQAGRSAELIRSIYKERFDIIKAKSKAEEIFSSISHLKKGDNKTRLISSFGKYGNYNLPFRCEKIVSISKNDFCSNIILDCFSRQLIHDGYSFVHMPYALSPTETDAIYIEQAKTAIIKRDEPDIISEEYFNITPYDSERIKCAYRLYDIALEEARRWFNIASDLHFRLEEIYSSSMDFTKNNEINSMITNEIRNILDL